MPPQGLLTIAAHFAKHWDVRFIDENVQPVAAADYDWADVVLVSGMHVQKPHINRINAAAHDHNKITVLGGPSVSACPEQYPGFDILHLGELGDATEEIIRYLDGHNARPAQQIRFQTQTRVPLDEFPIPAYRLVNLSNYFIASIQFSSGCPYSCEFCDIPELYGRRARFKSADRVLCELDAMLESGNPGAVYFVDDNFVANPSAAFALLPHLIRWQKGRGYPVQFACEATLNIAKNEELLGLMREAYFGTVFCGIETPEPAALKAISKRQNLAVPMLDSIRLLNSYGIEVVSGIIIGLDTDTPETGEAILNFIRASQIPMLTINLLHALPKTPLWRRLQAEGRLLQDEDRESNVDFLMPYEEVVGMWRRCVTEAYKPNFVYRRFLYQMENTYSRRIRLPNSKARLNVSNLRRGLDAVLRIIYHVGIASSYRRVFWKMFGSAMVSGDLESMIHIGAVAHHLIKFAEECEQRKAAAAFYKENFAQDAA